VAVQSGQKDHAGRSRAKLESVLVEPERRADEDDARAIVFAKAAEEQQQAD
jgi:hypothetical protein